MEATDFLRWGIVGCGNIAVKFAHDLLLEPRCTISAVASRNIDKARKEIALVYPQEQKTPV